MRLSEAIDQCVEIAFDEWFPTEDDLPKGTEPGTMKADLYNRIEGHIYAWSEDYEEA